MSEADWSSAAPIGLVRADEFARVMDRLSSVLMFSSRSDSELDRIVLGFRADRDVLAFASDGSSLVSDTIASRATPRADMFMSVPCSLGASVLKTFAPSDELELRLTQTAEAGTILIRSHTGAMLAQPVRRPDAHLNLHQAITVDDTTTTAWVSASELADLLNGTDLDGVVTFAFTPDKLIVRSTGGVIGSPIRTVMVGVPTRAEIELSRFWKGWAFARKRGPVWLPFVVFEIRQHGSVVKIYGADTTAGTGQPVYGDADFYVCTEAARGTSAPVSPARAKEAAPTRALSTRTDAAARPVERGDEVETILAELDALTGQAALKADIRRLLGQVRVNKEKAARGLQTSQAAIHMIFTGPPGTGKTTVARLVARLLHALGVLPGEQVVEVDKSGLVAAHIGGTEEKTAEVIERSIGGVLFIDEAYALPGDQFGTQAIDILLKALEDRRGEFVCIVAGYSEEMRTFVDSNPGIKSRFARTIAFAPYSAEELVEIGVSMARSSDNRFDDGALATLSVRIGDEDRRGALSDRRWGNARSMRNIVEAAVAARDVRIADAGLFDELSLTTIRETDVISACDDLRIGRAVGTSESVEDVLAELNRQVGQEQLKRQVAILVSGAKAAQLRASRGLATAPDLPHLVFAGPPGTGKTTIARLIARLYRALGLLSTGQVVEVDRSGLVGQYLGHTAEKTTKVIDDAMGGVLFIDEAYSLVTDGKGTGSDTFGAEAVNTLLKRLSDDSGRFVTIVAGYPEQMERFLQENPGLSRRFATKIEFASYSASELTQIAELMASDKGERLDDDARTLLGSRLEVAERAGQFTAKDWGNAGSVGNIVAQAGRLRNARLFADSAAPPSAEDLVRIRAEDIARACDSVLGQAEPLRETVEDVLAELSRQVGQDQLKRQVEVLLADARAAKLRREHGLDAGPPDLPHLLFTGPPGTGKTTIARLLARLYRALGVLPGGQVIEVDRGGLVEGYIGQTATKTTKVIDAAIGGILFIDEAYSLVSGRDAFGQEALDTLLKRMSDDQGRFVTIAAGYPRQMEQFLATNPGLRRRFATTIEFAPYSAAELTQIAAVMADLRHERLTEDAHRALRQRLDAAERAGVFQAPDWGNAGSIGNLVGEAVRVRNLGLGAAPTADELTTLTQTSIAAACDLALGSFAELQAADPAVVGRSGRANAPGSSALQPVASSKAAALDIALAELEQLHCVHLATRSWLAGVIARTRELPVEQRHGSLPLHWRFEGGSIADWRRAAGLLVRIYEALGLVPSAAVAVAGPEQLTADVGAGFAADIRTMIVESVGGALLVPNACQFLADGGAAEVVPALAWRTTQAQPAVMVVLADTSKRLSRVVEQSDGLKGTFPWAVWFQADTATDPVTTAASMPADITTIVGAVAASLAPGASPGVAAPAGPELAALGVAEVYWQRARSGTGGGMGLQLRFTPRSKDRMYYFAGGSNGQLPAIFINGGDSVPAGHERDLSDQVSPRTLREWRQRKDPTAELTQAILAAIAADQAD